MNHWLLSILILFTFCVSAGAQSSSELKRKQQRLKEDIAYKKAGVIIMDLVPTAQRQLHLFESHIDKHDALMHTLDRIHRRFGPHQMKLANQDLKRTWKMKQEHLSPRYTTLLQEIITVKTS